jgi:hypothetical protein
MRNRRSETLPTTGRRAEDALPYSTLNCTDQGQRTSVPSRTAIGADRRLPGEEGATQWASSIGHRYPEHRTSKTMYHGVNAATIVLANTTMPLAAPYEDAG